MHDELTLVKTVCRRLNDAGIAYMVSGSVALQFYGTPRMTRDVDIVVDIDEGDVQRIVDLFSDRAYVSEDAVRDAVRRRGMFNIIDNETVDKVDFIVRKNEPYRIEELHRRRRIALDDVEICVVAPEDLILSKLVWGAASGSELQRRDVVSLMKAGIDLDRDYLGRWAPSLGVAKLLDELEKESSSS